MAAPWEKYAQQKPSGGVFSVPAEPDPDKALRHQMLQLELQQKMKEANGTDGSKLSPEALDAETTNWILTGKMSPLGMGNGPLRVQIENNRPVVMRKYGISENQLPSIQQMFKADSDAYNKRVGQGSFLKQAEEAAHGHASQIETYLKSLPAQGNATALNAISSFAQRKMSGETITNLDATIPLLKSEIAKIMTANPSGAGQLTDDARHEFNILEGNVAPARKIEALHALLQMADTKVQANNDEGTRLSHRMTGGLSSYAGSAGSGPGLSDGPPPANTPPTGPRELTPEQKAQFFDILQKQGADKADEYLSQFGQRMKDKAQAKQPYSKGLELTDGSYANSYAGQGLSGVNEGLASTLGAPVDLTTAAMNLIPKGLNAIANTNIPTISDPVAGGDWWKRRLASVGSILPSSEDGSKQFVRRVGQSVGAAAIPAGASGSLARAGAGLLSGLGGGIGAATAQQIAPGNPLAEMAGDVAGSGLTGFGLLRAAQRAAQRGVTAAVPTVSDLKDQAAELYRRAETRGVTANPDQTKQLAATIEQALKDEGQIGPAGSITNSDTNTSKAFNLIQQYAGQEMNPTEMNTIRTVLSDSRQSPDAADRRLGNILLDHFDNWVSPLAPEFKQARSVASRYLQGQDLEQARELAGARASQFTGSGFENALRTEYRGLDRNNIKGNNYFNPDVVDAIQTVARGTPTSNLLRGLGRLAPTGPVSGMGSLIPALGIGSMTTPATGGAVGTALAGTGVLGRVGATRMGIKAADNAELIARNGGALPQAELLPKSLKDYIAWLAATQAAKYQNNSSGQ